MRISFQLQEILYIDIFGGICIGDDRGENKPIFQIISIVVYVQFPSFKGVLVSQFYPYSRPDEIAGISINS